VAGKISEMEVQVEGGITFQARTAPKLADVILLSATEALRDETYLHLGATNHRYGGRRRI
jgi:hypothetical protein